MERLREFVTLSSLMSNARTLAMFLGDESYLRVNCLRHHGHGDLVMERGLHGTYISSPGCRWEEAQEQVWYSYTSNTTLNGVMTAIDGGRHKMTISMGKMRPERKFDEEWMERRDEQGLFAFLRRWERSWSAMYVERCQVQRQIYDFQEEARKIV